MNLREAAQQALEALEESERYYGSDSALRDAIQTLRAALEQPEQRCEYIRTSGNTHWCALSGREWQGLTDDETMHLMNETYGNHWADEAHIQRFRKAIEAALKEKNK
jgi:hypothetical protein